MVIGIIEIMPNGHYTLVESLVKIYSSDPDNQIYIFTHQVGYEILQPIISKSENIHLVYKKENETINDFINIINTFDFNKLYVVTLDSYFSQIQKLNEKFPLYLFVHNNENWFLLSFGHLFYRFFANVSRTKSIIYSLKVSFIYPFFKKKIKKQVIDSNGKFVVLNKILKEDLLQYIENDKIEVIPFSIYNPSLQIKESNHTILRVCIPGILDDTRRDYYSVFKCIESDIDFFKDKIELELLGGTNDIENNRILKEAKRLIDLGIRIKYHAVSFIPFNEYDESLANADIILGNFYTVLNKYSVYGKTKETGVVFTMIRVAKPGILPEDYNLIEELASSTLKFNSYLDLTEILKNLILDKSLLFELSQEAKKNSLQFEPKHILNSIQNGYRN